MPSTPDSGFPSAFLAQVRRDLSMVVGGLAGVQPAPFSARAPMFEGTVTGIQARGLVVEQVRRETADAVTVWLRDAGGRRIEFRPGQFLTLVVRVGSEELRRAYSLSSACFDERGEAPERVAITIKRVADGRVSNHINDTLRERDLVRVLGPSGDFVPPAVAEELVLIAGGSGVTPMRSIVLSELAPEGQGRCITMLYGNRSEADVIFRDELRALHAADERFTLREALSEPSDEWNGLRGLLTDEVIGAELDRHEFSAGAHYMLCGPEPMLEQARAALLARGIPEHRIHEERFVQPGQRTQAKRPEREQTVQLRVKGRDHEVVVEPGKTLLDAATERGIDVPFSCAMGGCGRCKMKLKKGDVVMDEPNCLTDEERADGWVLSCVGCPTEASELEVV